jgi:hypothetical protein
MQFAKTAYAVKNVSSSLRMSSSYQDLNATIEWCFSTK